MSAFSSDSCISPPSLVRLYALSYFPSSGKHTLNQQDRNSDSRLVSTAKTRFNVLSSRVVAWSSLYPISPCRNAPVFVSTPLPVSVGVLHGRPLLCKGIKRILYHTSATRQVDTQWKILFVVDFGSIFLNFQHLMQRNFQKRHPLSPMTNPDNFSVIITNTRLMKYQISSKIYEIIK